MSNISVLFRDALDSVGSIAFQSDSFSHGQGASVNLSYDSKNTLTEDQAGDLNQAIFDLMQLELSESSIMWAGDFSIEAKLVSDEFVFDLTLVDDGMNYWEIYNPIYDICIIDFWERLKKNVAEPDRSLVSDLPLCFSVSIQIDKNKDTALDISFDIDEDSLEKGEVVKPPEHLFPKLVNIVSDRIELAIRNHSAAVKQEDIEDYGVKLKIKSAPYWGNADEHIEEYSAWYQKELKGRNLEEKLNNL